MPPNDIPYGGNLPPGTRSSDINYEVPVHDFICEHCGHAWYEETWEDEADCPKCNTPTKGERAQ
jgi:rubrerythrin